MNLATELDVMGGMADRFASAEGLEALNHGALLKRMHIDADTFRKVIDTLVQSELVVATQLTRGGFRYTLIGGV